jgi:putative sigma-54 modulation protein
MRLQVKGKNVEISPSIREYAERKHPSIAESHIAEGTIFTKGPTLRVREASPDMKASIDQLAEKLERQVKRYRERRIVEPRRHAPHHGETSNGSTPRPPADDDDE